MVGGIGTHVSALVPALSRHGVEVTLVTPRWSGGEHESQLLPAMRVCRVDPSLPTVGNYFADARQTNLKLEAFANAIWSKDGQGEGQGTDAFDVIHAHDWLVAFAAVGLKNAHKVPLVATIHATERGRGKGHLQWEISHAIDQAEWTLAYEAWRVITPSRFMAEEVRDYFQVPLDKSEIVPNGVDTSRFDALREMDLDDFRAKWATPDQKIVFFVGRLEPQKGAHLLLEAAPHAFAHFPNAKIILAGTGGMEFSLRRRIAEMGLGEKVIMTGFLPDAERDKLYTVADVAVFPSLYEPFGIVALEAMAARCPVLVTDVGGLREVVTHNETGIVVYPDNVESLAWGIVHTLQRPDWSAQRAANAYRMVSQEYTWDRIAERTIKVYQRVLGERRRVRWE